MKTIIAFNLALLVAGLVLLELVFGSWFSDASPLYQFIKPRNVQKTYKTGFEGQPDVSSYTVDEYGFRGLDKGLGEIFIVTVGGSTTDQKYIDDAFTFEAVLQQAFANEGRDVDIVSAGIDGQSTFGHLKNFPYWFDKLPGFSPRYILFYVGVNDFYNDAELTKFDAMQYEGIRAFRKRFESMLRDKSALYAAGRIVASLISPPRVAHFNEGRPPPWSADEWTTESNIDAYRTEAVAQSLAMLRTRITALADATRKTGAEPIFVTQRSAYWVERNGQIWGRKVVTGKRSPGALQEFGSMTGVDHYWFERLQASAIMEACGEAKGVCIDLAGNIAFDPETDFYDHVHTTPSGSRKIGAFLYPYLKPLP